MSNHEVMEWEQQPYMEGMVARSNNLPESANPYTGRNPPSNFDSWQAGWHEADRNKKHA